jgi:RND family efflux transporter MFP subunit
MKSALFLLISMPLLAQTPATTRPATAGPWVKSVTLPAEVVAYYRVHLGTPVTGWIESVKADVGSRVKANDVLAEIRAPELVAARDARAEEARAAKQKIAQAASVLRSAEALAKAAKSEAARIAGLAGSGTVTSKARDEADLRSAAADAKVAEAEAMIHGAEAEALAAAARETEAAAALEYTRITAPFDGLVVERSAELGDFLGPASKRGNLFTVEQVDPLRVRLQIPEHAAAFANAGDPLVIRISGLEIATKLTRLAGSLDPVTKTMTAEVDLPGTTALLPGAYGTAALTLESLENAVLVPLAALRSGPDGSRFVLVQDGDSQRNVPVKFIALDGSTAVLSAGPANGEKVILP